jgi:hypothetical protein
MFTGQIQRVVEQREGLPLLFPRHDLGVTYTASAATHQDPTSQASSHAEAANSTDIASESRQSAHHPQQQQQQQHERSDSIDNVALINGTQSGVYVASGCPGARLPHAWLQGRTPLGHHTDDDHNQSRADDRGEDSGEVQRVSSLDLVAMSSGNVFLHAYMHRHRRSSVSLPTSTYSKFACIYLLTSVIVVSCHGVAHQHPHTDTHTHTWSCACGSCWRHASTRTSRFRRRCGRRCVVPIPGGSPESRTKYLDDGVRGFLE